MSPTCRGMGETLPGDCDGLICNLQVTHSQRETLIRCHTGTHLEDHTHKLQCIVYSVPLFAVCHHSMDASYTVIIELGFQK